ncbi:MAG: ABC transporter permease [Bacteroidales bacterium]
MLNREFAWLLVIAFAIAVPLAWYAMDRWLGGFAHNAGLTIWPFLLAASVAFLVTYMAVGYHAWRIMRRNPAETLQHE